MRSLLSFFCRIWEYLHFQSLWITFCLSSSTWEDEAGYRYSSGSCTAASYSSATSFPLTSGSATFVSTYNSEPSSHRGNLPCTPFGYPAVYWLHHNFWNKLKENRKWLKEWWILNMLCPIEVMISLEKALSRRVASQSKYPKLTISPGSLVQGLAAPSCFKVKVFSRGLLWFLSEWSKKARYCKNQAKKYPISE